MGHRCCGAEVFYFVLKPHKAEVIYFIFNSEMENRTLFQICGRLYFPTFLFKKPEFKNQPNREVCHTQRAYVKATKLL